MSEDNKQAREALASRVEKHVKRCAAFFDLALKAYPEMMFCIAHEDGTFDEFYGLWHECLGWTLEELSRTPWIQLVHPDDAKKTLEEAEEMKKRDTIKFINRYRCKDGKYKTFEWTCLSWNGNGTSYCLVRVI